MSLWFLADVETSGFTPIYGCIWQVAIVAVRGSEIVGEFESKVRPIPELWTEAHKDVARKISGLEEKHFQWLENCTPFPDQVSFKMETFINDLREVHQIHQPQISSYNRRFDKAFLEVEPYSLSRRSNGEWGPCLMYEAKKAMGTKQCVKLAEACAWFGIDPRTGHRALADARAAAKLAIALGLTREKEEKDGKEDEAHSESCGRSESANHSQRERDRPSDSIAGQVQTVRSSTGNMPEECGKTSGNAETRRGFVIQ